MRCTRLGLGMLGALASAGSLQQAQGSPITWGFTGEITYTFDEMGIFGDDVQVGSPFSVEFSFESTTLDVLPGSAFEGLYHGAVLDLSGVMGEIPFSGAGTSNVIRVLDQPRGAPDSWSMVIRNLMVPALGERAYLNIVLQGSTGGMFSDDSLPTFPPDLASLDFTLFYLVTEIDAAEALGEIHAIIPEPCTLWLIAVGAGGLAGLRRRRD